MDIELLQMAYKDWKTKLSSYQKKYNYYKGKTDAIDRLKAIDAEIEKESNILNYNMVKKFIKEEISYSLSNGITLQSLTEEDTDAVTDISYYTAHWSKKHNTEMLKRSLIFNESYELYHINQEGDIDTKVLTPLSAYVYENEFGEVEFLMNIFKRKFDDSEYIDVHTSEGIHHYKDDFEELGYTEHYFKEVPCSICRLNISDDDDTIFDDISKLQDAYSINLSNISSEITEYRLAYLKIKKGEIAVEDIPKLKELGILQGDFEDIDWLIKDINDSFVSNTLNRLKEDMFEITGHINTNQKLQSNISGVTLRSRLISLENRCKLNQQSMHDCINNRLRILFNYLHLRYNKEHDWRNLDVKFTLSIPHDDYLTAQIINLIGDRMSTSTALEQLSFITNGQLEKTRADKEKLNSIIDLDSINLDIAEDEHSVEHETSITDDTSVLNKSVVNE